MLDKETKKALIDRFEGWELVEFLGIETEDIIEAFEERILEDLNEVLEFAGIQGLDNNNDDE